MNKVEQQPHLAFVVAFIAVGALSTMDAVMKGMSQNISAYATMCWRSVLAALLLAVPYFMTRKSRPTVTAVRLHMLRGALMVPMSFLFFWGLARVPIAQAIALTFIAPLMSLFLAALFLRERIGPRIVAGSLLAFAGVVTIVYGQGQADLGPEALKGSIAILGSAVCYAFNIVVMRSQAQNAGPIEIAFFQFIFTGIGFWALSPIAGVPVYPSGQELVLAAATLLAIAGMLLLAWAYARAGAAYLSSSEYSGFLFAMVLGWFVFGETVSSYTVAGAALIVGGCIIAARPVAKGEPAVELAV